MIQKSLKALYEIDLQDYYAAVVKDYKPMTYKPPQPEKLHVNHSAYFNSGVMIMNLDVFRRESEKIKRGIEFRAYAGECVRGYGRYIIYYGGIL